MMTWEKNPQRDLPSNCIIYRLHFIYAFVSAVIVGLVPYYALDPDIPILSAFFGCGMEWAVYLITTGAVTALYASLLGSILSQPRIFIAMARDGLPSSFFSNINGRTQVYVKSTIVTGVLAASLAFFMDVSQLAGMVSVGTLLAFTTFAVSVFILRYVPSNKLLIPSSLQTFGDPLSLNSGGDVEEDRGVNPVGCLENSQQNLHEETGALLGHSLITKKVTKDEQNEQTRCKYAAWTIALCMCGDFCLCKCSFSRRVSQFTLCGLGGFILFCSIVVLACMDQDDARRSFGHTGGFVCPFVPLLPAACILTNTYLLIDLG